MGGQFYLEFHPLRANFCLAMGGRIASMGHRSSHPGSSNGLVKRIWERRGPGARWETGGGRGARGKRIKEPGGREERDSQSGVWGPCL